MLPLLGGKSESQEEDGSEVQYSKTPNWTKRVTDFPNANAIEPVQNDTENTQNLEEPVEMFYSADPVDEFVPMN